MIGLYFEVTRPILTTRRIVVSLSSPARIPLTAMAPMKPSKFSIKKPGRMILWLLVSNYQYLSHDHYLPSYIQFSPLEPRSLQ